MLEPSSRLATLVDSGRRAGRAVAGMALEQKLHLKLAQKLVMTPTLQQAIKLLQYSRLELEEAMTQEAQVNPLLDTGGACANCTREWMSRTRDLVSSRGPRLARERNAAPMGKTSEARHAARAGEHITLCGQPIWRTRMTLPDDPPTCGTCLRICRFQRRRHRAKGHRG